ncbi:MAG: T9SS type A sorting domain-containing protein [Bacteroidia bacterium]
MRSLVIAFGLVVVSSLYAQCTMCMADPNKKVTPYGFNPSTLQLRAGSDTIVTIHFTFPDSVRREGFLLAPNYAIYAESTRVDIGRVQPRGGTWYNASDPSAGGLHFDQMHRTKEVRPGANARVIVYQNPGTTLGATSPYGCVTACMQVSSNLGSDTFRLKVRVFIPSLGDGNNKDTTNLQPQILGRPAWLDTVFSYVVEVKTQVSSLSSLPKGVSQISLAPNPAYQEAQLRLTVQEPVCMHVQVFNPIGQEVHTQVLSLPVGSQEIPLRLAPGFYTVRLTSGGVSYTEKLIIY